MSYTVTEHFTKFLIDLHFHISVTQKFICFDAKMDFPFDNNMITTIAIINKHMRLVKLYHV